MNGIILIFVGLGIGLFLDSTPPAFDLDGFLDKMDKQTHSLENSGGLVSLGESFGLVDKRTSDLLKKGAQAAPALQPIQWEEEKSIGSSLAAEVFNRYGGSVNDAELLHYVNLVGKTVASMSDRADINYHFAILNNDAPNAFATPGGYVFVSRGLLSLIKNEAQLAGVLGHEIAHVTHKHVLKTIERSRSLEGIDNLTMASLNKDPVTFNRVLDTVSDILFTYGLDQELEFEADRVGMEYANRAGYNPASLKYFIRILGRANSGVPSMFFSTHPSPKDRHRSLVIGLTRYGSTRGNPDLSKRYIRLTQGKL